MTLSILGVNVNVPSAYEAVRKGGRKVPPIKQPPTPPGTNSGCDIFNHIKNFFGRSICAIRNNTFASIGVFAAANCLFLAVADKVNDLAKDLIDKYADSEMKQKAAKHGITGTVVFIGNCTVSQMFGYSFGLLALTTMSVGVVALKTLYKEGYQAFKLYQENQKRNAETTHSQASTSENIPANPPPAPANQPINETTSSETIVDTAVPQNSANTITPEGNTETAEGEPEVGEPVTPSPTDSEAAPLITAPATNPLTASTLNPTSVKSQLQSLNEDLAKLESL